MSRRRYGAFLVITLLAPLLLLGVIEGGLRLLAPHGGLPLFVPASFVGKGYRVANPRVAARYFPGEAFPPSPPAEPFAAERPAHGLRIFVLGASSTAGFPFPHNGTFSRVLRDALSDVLPDDSVEVVNLGIAATNSFTMLDFVGDVLEQRPDLVLVYGGHNEFYGALGVGSAQSGLASPGLKRLYLQLLRLRTVQLLRSAVVAVRGAGAGARPADRSQAATMMEIVARDQQIVLGSDEYREGVRQFEENLSVLVERCRRAGVPVFLASLASNVRDLHPLVSPGNGGVGGADSTFEAASRALASGDSAQARGLFVRARDLDVVRFRAPTEFNAVVHRLSARDGVHYVPVAERFDQESAGMPGAALFLEHVHPTRDGQLLIARTFFEAIRDAGLAGRRVQLGRLRSWESYEDRMALSPFDLRVALHTVRTLASQWPFVPADQARDYRGSYRPDGLVDSLALLVSRGGMPWGAAKLELAERYEQRGAPDSAVTEYRGLSRDAPFAELPNRLLGRALLASGKPAAAESSLVRAFRVEPSSYAALTLGRMAVARRDLPRAIPYLEAAVRLSPTDPVAIYSLSLAYGMAKDLPRARAAAEQLRRVAPDFPGLAQWQQVIGAGR